MMVKKFLKFGWEILTPLIVYAIASLVDNIAGTDIDEILGKLRPSLRSPFVHSFEIIFIAIIVLFLSIELVLIRVRGSVAKSGLATPAWIKWLVSFPLEALSLLLAFVIGVSSNEAASLLRESLHGSRWPEPQTTIVMLTLLGLLIILFRLIDYYARKGRWFGIRDEWKLLEELSSLYKNFNKKGLMDTTQAKITASDLPTSAYILPYRPDQPIGNQTLWLSEPGGGKTAQLYRVGDKLADAAQAEWDAIQKAEVDRSLRATIGDAGDTARPVIYIPFILDVSSWAFHPGSFENWLIAAIVSTYDVYSGLAKRLVMGDDNHQRARPVDVRVLPMLDSLDVMREDKIAHCLEAINKYLADTRVAGESKPLIICCRTKVLDHLRGSLPSSDPEAAVLSSFPKVVIQPLSENAILKALRETNLAFLESEISRNSRWREFLETPLHLSLLQLAAGRNTLSIAEQEQLRALAAPEESQNEMREKFIEAYLDHLYAHSRKSKEILLRALAWLAHLLEPLSPAPPPAEGPKETKPEETTSSAPAWLRRLYAWFTISSEPLDQSKSVWAEPISSSFYQENLQIECLPVGDRSQREYPRIVFALRNLVRLLIAIVFALGIGAAVFLANILGQNAFPSSSYVILGLVVGLFALISGLGVAFSTGSQISDTDQIKLIDRIAYDRHHSWAALLLVGGGVSLGLGLFIWQSALTGTSPVTRMFYSVGLGVNGGVFVALILDFIARLSRLRTVEVSQSLSKYQWPGQGVSRSIRSAIRVLILDSLVGFLIGGLVIGPIAGLLAGAQSRTVFDAIILAVAGASVGALVGALGTGTFIGVNRALNNGGAAALQHRALRIALNRSQVLPHHITRLLDEATRYGLLSRVGGGYKFVAHLLQEQLATQYQSLILDEVERQRLAASERKQRRLAFRVRSWVKRRRARRARASES